MILSTMSSQEIADHIYMEYKSVEKRILGKIRVECKTLTRLKRSTLTFTDRTRNMTVFTVYIASTERGLHTTGVWYESVRGKVFAVAGFKSVNFFSKHFFERYAERFIKKVVPVKEAAKHFFYKNILKGIYVGPLFDTENIPNRIAVIYEQGVALGSFVAGDHCALNTFIANEMLFPKQLELVERIRIESDEGKKIVALHHGGENHEIQAFTTTQNNLLNIKTKTLLTTNN